MSIEMSQASSRPLGVARSLIGGRIDEAAVYARTVVLTGETAALQTPNGRWCFLDALALLSRIAGQLVLRLPPGVPALEGEVREFAARAFSRNPIHIDTTVNNDAVHHASAILNIGTQVPPNLPWTTINSNGWLARLSSTTDLPGDMQQRNPMAALMAASLGATEVFKRIFSIPSSVAPQFERTSLSLFDLRTGTSAIGPQLPSHLQLPDTLLCGAGALCNAIALLLGRLPVRGRLHVVDKQDYAEENFGTCVLTDTIDWIRRPKAERLRDWLRTHTALTVTGEKITIEQAIHEERFHGLSVEVILSGFDEAAPRREAQRLWPSLLIDGGINEVGAAVIRHSIEETDACLMCWFQAPKVDEKALQSQWTGLQIASLQTIDRPLCDQDIETANETKQLWLRERQQQGKTVCSIISEAQLAQLGVVTSDGFQPSAPFVATASGSLVISELIKALAFPTMKLPASFQLGNIFNGPEYNLQFDRPPSPECQCVLQRAAIRQLAGTRQARR